MLVRHGEETGSGFSLRSGRASILGDEADFEEPAKQRSLGERKLQRVEASEMAPVRENIQAKDEYLRELGRAAYNFAYLEWGIVWLAETLEPGLLVDAQALTAGQIARRFLTAVESIPATERDLPELTELARNFVGLVEERNRLLHGNPFTADNGEQRLLYSGKHGRKDWTEELMQQFSDDAATLGSEAGRLLHGGRYEQWKRNSGQ